MSPPRRIDWRKQAVDDLAAIGRHIALHSPINADRFLDDIVAHVELLTIYPFIGRSGLKPGTRELIVHTHYIVIYRVLPTVTSVLRVKHVAKKRPP